MISGGNTMKNRCRSIRLSARLSIVAAVFSMFAVLMFAGCSADGEAPPAEIPFYPVVVYDDGVYAVECTDLSFEKIGDSAGKAAFRLRVTNNSTDSMALSSVLGIRVTADGNPCPLLSNDMDKSPVDGLIDAGCSREGWITVQMPVGASGFTVEMAVDYLGDQWISFSVSR